MRTQEIPLSALALNVKQGIDGDVYEHDLAAMAAFIKTQQQKDHPGCRICFDYLISGLRSDNIRHPAIIVERQNGYVPTTFDIGSTDKTAVWNIDRANAALALTQKEVNDIIASSM